MTTTTLKPKSACPKLASLAEACHNGACNSYALARSLAEALAELGPGPATTEHPAYKIVLGQLSYLAGESCGPSPQALEEYEAWAKPASFKVSLKTASDEWADNEARYPTKASAEEWARTYLQGQIWRVIESDDKPNR